MEPQDKKPDQGPPEIFFSTFLYSLGSAALIALGVAPNPVTGKIEKNLDLARQNIDLLALIKEKTKGNLTPEEQSLLDNLLYDLRMRYVEEVSP